MGSRKYPMLNDEVWLREMYEGRKMSTKRIAVLAGAKGPGSVRQALVRFGIPVRGIREGQIANREDDHFVLNLPVITGSLLGDAWLAASSRGRTAGVRFEKGNVGRDHALYVASLIFSSDPEDRVWEIPVRDGDGCNHRPQHRVVTLSHDCLRPLIDAWYPAETGYRKVVPSDVVVDETVLLHWFLDDGHARWNGEDRGYVVFCSESFVQEDQQRLCDLMNGHFGLGAYLIPYRSGTGWRIRIPQERTALLYEVIGRCPVPSMEHKWLGVYPLQFAHPQLRDEAWLRQRYVSDGMSFERIGEIVGADPSLVSYYVQKMESCGSKERVPLPRRRKYQELSDPEWLYQKHIVQGLSSAAIAREIGCDHYRHVSRTIKRFRETHWARRGRNPDAEISHLRTER